MLEGFDAATASVAAFSPSATKWRALIPVRAEIHSSVVSSTPSRSLLVTILPPSPSDAEDPADSAAVQADLPSDETGIWRAPLQFLGQPAGRAMPSNAFSTPVAASFRGRSPTSPREQEGTPMTRGPSVFLTPTIADEGYLRRVCSRDRPSSRSEPCPGSRAPPSAVLRTMLPVKPSVTSTSATPRCLDPPHYRRNECQTRP